MITTRLIPGLLPARATGAASHAILAWRAGIAEISGQAVTFVDGRGTARVLSRDQGDQHRVVRLGSGRYRQPGLAIAGSGTVIPLPFFSVREVRRQCLAAGWSFASRG